MSKLTIIAIDRNSSDTMSRTFSTENIETFKSEVKEFENELPYSKYELMCDEPIDSIELTDALDELCVTI